MDAYRIDESEPLETVRRFDRGTTTVVKARIDENGFLRAPAVFSRTGVFEYRNDNGTIRRELRLPEEVFSPVSVKSFETVPVTDTHPPRKLTPDIAQQYVRGVASGVHQDGDLLSGEIVVYDGALIAAVQRGDRVELSCGYDCSLEFKPGEYKGERYDAIQRNIRGNHVAVVQRGRAGSKARIRLDSGDAIELANYEESERADSMKIKINGVEYEATEQVGQALESERKAHADELAKVSARADEAAKALVTANARADEASKAADKLRTDAADSSRFDAAVASRAALESQARSVLGDADLSGKSDTQVRLDVLDKLDDKLEDTKRADAGYVTAYFDAAIKRAGATQLADVRGKTVVKADGKPVTNTDERVKAAKAKSANRWKSNK